VFQKPIKKNLKRDYFAVDNRTFRRIFAACFDGFRILKFVLQLNIIDYIFFNLKYITNKRRYITVR